MEIKFHGKYDKNLFFRSVRLANQPARSQRFLQPLMLVFVLVALGVLVVRLVNSGDILGNASYIAVIMIAGSFVARAYMLPYLAARKLWTNPALQADLKGSITRNGITYSLNQGQNEMYLAARKLWANPALQADLKGSITRNGITYSLNQGQNEMPWSRFRRIRRARGLTTLVARDGLLVIFPRHFFKTDNDWLKFNQLVDNSIIPIK